MGGRNTSSGVDHQFTGQQRDDDTGLDYFWGRSGTGTELANFWRAALDPSRLVFRQAPALNCLPGSARRKSEYRVGAKVKERGFCTHAFLLRGRTPGVLEHLLGFREGRLSEGAAILFLEKLPCVGDFELAGFTYFSDGAVQGHKLDKAARDPYRMESLLRTDHRWSDKDIRETPSCRRKPAIRPSPCPYPFMTRCGAELCRVSSGSRDSQELCLRPARSEMGWGRRSAGIFRGLTKNGLRLSAEG